ncbi:MAG: CsgG/HfaB family protein [Bacteroidota bacterium]
MKTKDLGWKKSGLMVLSLLLLLFCSSCGSFLQQPIQPAEARLGEETQGTIELKSLPPPKDQIVVAVYKFTDQTGQYKPAENGASWSTAVTQGATSILLKALENSGWFIPIERENVGNLLNERKIIRSSRKQYSNNDQQILPPLLYAGVILEGGIVSYDANVITGGAGLRYFGAGASSQYRQDRVTVYLRAVSTSNGKILKTVYTSKTILSQAVDVGLFRFVRFRRLLEAETGFTYNEPSELAVTEAIEKAVLSLIIEGVFDGLWTLEEARMEVSKPFLEYKKEKKLIPQTDVFGKRLNNRRRKVAFTAGTTSLLYKGDYPDPLIRTGVELGVSYTSSPYLSAGINYGLSQVSTKDFFQSDVSYLEAEMGYRILPFDILTPYIFGGAGLITQNQSSRFDMSGDMFTKLHAGAGMEYLFSDNVGLKVSADYNYLMSDRLDDVEQGRYNDFYWRLNVGINFYFGELIDSKRKFEYKRQGTR